ncbi:2-keto-4-pentenoate hydratase [Streptomyces sp. NBC_01669]|uniref:2-keto-4-pentenoate hydratase n=1 Tax=Streptomyces sp. NBC_01669 TaxID=2975909 RepID=UPI0022597F6A|nr:fumarylacetoacetate hydrolase family protein [Streptomyces sp. NBC_01669]MCX4538242.1 fumarylacetoacetate hydrolase family protein [Streptomyces sp. NBC_01669]
MGVPPDGAISAAAERLLRAEREGVPAGPVRDLLGASDIDAGYAVQNRIIEHKIQRGSRAVGRKIGLTSESVQRQFGVYQPDFGVLLDDMVLADRTDIALSRFSQPRVEAEIAFVLGADLTAEATVADVVRATDFVLPAIEIVDSRIADWDIRISDTVADNASSGAVVLGASPKRLSELDLATLGMTLEHHGEPVSTGAGAACLGSPVNAVSWLAREVARRGRPLRAGEVILAGAWGPMVPVTAPGSYLARFEGIGEVRASFIAESKEATPV